MKITNITKSAITALSFAMIAAGCASTKNNRYPEENQPKPTASKTQVDEITSEQINTDLDQPKDEIEKPEHTEITVGYDEEQYQAPGQTKIFFPYDSSALGNDDLAQLEALANWLKANPEINIDIEGHADERGSTAYNLALGERRAKMVKRHLVAMGVEEDRLNIISYGEELPLADGETVSAYRQNRRVEFDASAVSLSYK